MKKIKVSKDLFEHILNCMANQKFIHEQKPGVQKEWQQAIDDAWNDGMKLLNKG